MMYGISRILSNITIRTLCTRNLQCWKCGTQVSALFCPNCKIIQKPAPKQHEDYFSVFGLSQNFDVDPKELTVKYRKMQSQLHPDKFSNSSQEEKNISDEYSSLVNKAYSTLHSPLSRALHLLKIHNENLSEDEKVDDAEFLMEMMELNEEVEEADTGDKLKQLNEKNKTVLNKLINEISKSFKSNDVKLAKKGIIKMKYYNSLGLRINNLLREKGITD